MVHMLKHDTDPVVGRFAPSPTGPLHFGSLIAALGSYCLARRSGGKWLLRIEDLDTPRVMAGAADEIQRTLERLGLAWDGEVLFQSRRLYRYELALEQLRHKGLLFACGCSRREILASAPHAGEEGPIYPGTCRSGLNEGSRPSSLRLRVFEKQICFMDGVFGRREQCLKSAVGDFVLRRADGLFAYQLAVVVDDAESGVNQVVRGEDLLLSTPRQIYLQSCLGYPVPVYIHLPLVLTPDGEKVSKRHGTVTAMDKIEGGTLLWRALRFLGQPVPVELLRAPATEVLSWGVGHFALDLIPQNQPYPKSRRRMSHLLSRPPC
jgi:glutamyl-Q tRNA(Asp) synthetase